MGKVRVAMSSPKLWADGMYEARLQDPEITPPKEGKEHPTLKLPVVIIDGDKEKTVQTFFSFHPNAIWKLKQLLDRMDVEYESETVEDDDGNEVESLEFDPSDLAGKSALAKVGTREYQGKHYQEIKELVTPV